MRMSKKEVYEIMKCNDTCKVDTSSKTCEICSHGMEIEDFLSASTSLFRKFFTESGNFIYHSNGNSTSSNFNLNQYEMKELEKALKRARGFSEIEKMNIGDYCIEIIIRDCEISYNWNLLVEVHLPKDIADPEYDHIIP